MTSSPEIPLRSVIVAFSIAIIAILVRFTIWVLLGGKDVETFEYEGIATNLLAGRGFGVEHHATWYRTFGSPPYAFFTYFMYFVFGQHQDVVLISQWFFSVATTAGCFLIGNVLWSPTVGVIAALLTAFHPGIIFYDTHKLAPLSLDAALSVWSVFVLLFYRYPSLPTAFFMGVLHGLAVFERAVLFGLVPLSLFVIWRRSEKTRVLLKLAAIYFLGVAIVFSPWVFRNLLVYSRPVLISTTAAEVFWRGNNPQASGGAFGRDQPGLPVFRAAPKSFQEQILGKDEIAQSRVFFREGMAFVVGWPFSALRLYVKKLVAFWWFSSHAGFLYPAQYLVIYQVYYSFIMALAGVCIIVLIRSWDLELRRRGAAIVLFLASVGLLQAVFYVETRHRWSVEPLLLVLAAQGGVFITRWTVGYISPRVGVGRQ